MTYVTARETIEKIVEKWRDWELFGRVQFGFQGFQIRN